MHATHYSPIPHSQQCLTKLSTSPSLLSIIVLFSCGYGWLTRASREGEARIKQAVEHDGPGGEYQEDAGRQEM
jgi:hypothetical protein